MSNTSIVVLDIGGTKINSGRFRDGKIESSQSFKYDANGTESEILDLIKQCIAKQLVDDTCGLSIGVPGIVDIEKGIVYEVVNIDAWNKFNLKTLLESHFNLPTYINNDANCFTVGENYFGRGKGISDMVGICLGTGFGAGIVLNGNLCNGQHCSAGEIGSINYLSGVYDDYCSGQYFKKFYNSCGSDIATMAKSGDKKSLKAFQDFGHHLAMAITNLLLIIDPKLIVVGGSVGKSFDLYIDSVWHSLQDFPYKRIVENLEICQSDVPDIALLGAAQLFILHHKEQAHSFATNYRRFSTPI